MFFFKKKRNYSNIIFDVFSSIQNINKDNKFSEYHLDGVYDVFEKYHKNYSILIRPYPETSGPLKMLKFLKIVSKENRNIIFEYDFFKTFDFAKMLIMIFRYPFEVLNMRQDESNNIDKIFNNSLIQDLQYFNLSSFGRYILGEKLSKIKTISKIYSWNEFQAIERSINYGIRKNCENIKIIGLQFLVTFETYFNLYIDDIENEIQSLPHLVLVNGKKNLLARNNVKYECGISPRYKKLFYFNGVKYEKNIILLGSYFVSDTQLALNNLNSFDDVIFKKHPTTVIEDYKLPKNVTTSDDNIYKLFENAKAVLSPGSGSSLEAIACGIPVVILENQHNFTINPLTNFGKGKIWQITSDINDIKPLCDKLINYKKNNQDEIKKIATWYRDNFFLEPQEEKIKFLFEI